MAVGVTRVADPPMGLAVLYPADSDAVRAMLRRVLGTALAPDGEVEGLALFRAGEGLAVALDDDVILVGTSPELLRGAAARHAGKDRDVSLAGTQAFFSLHPASSRSEDLLTAWADADLSYRQWTEWMGTDLPVRLSGLNALFDLEHLQEIHGRLHVEQARLHINLEGRHADDHQALIYDVIRPLGWTDADLRSVPREAAEAITTRLGGAARHTARTLHRWTGINFERFTPPGDSLPPAPEPPPIEPPPEPAAADPEPALNLGRLAWLPHAIARLLWNWGAPADRWLPGRIAAVLNHSRMTLRADEDANRLALEWTIVPIPELQSLFPLLFLCGKDPPPDPAATSAPPKDPGS
jgi:hypothetical protein